MRPSILRITRKMAHEAGLPLASLLLAATMSSVPALAQPGALHVDAKHSVVRFSLGSGANATEIGLARVSGNVALGATNPVVNLDIKPDNGMGAQFSEITFKAKKSEVTDNGQVAVTGDLSVIRVERSLTLDPNEGYHGAEYGEPVTHKYSYEVTLVFPQANVTEQNGAQVLSASTTVDREDFPQLIEALAPGNWPTRLVDDENCTMPSSVSEGYAGANCTGELITTAEREASPSSAAVSEGYYGVEPATALDESQATITLTLKVI